MRSATARRCPSYISDVVLTTAASLNSVLRKMQQVVGLASFNRYNQAKGLFEVRGSRVQ